MMTQQLQQSIKLLQMSSLELNTFIEQELEKNPLLEMEENEPNETGEEEPAEKNEPDENENNEIIEPVEDPAFEWEQYDTPIKSSSNAEVSEDAESYTASEISLRDFLLEQLLLECNDSKMRIIGQHLIDMVDESGYIREDIATVAHLLECPLSLIEATLSLLQRFEPSGVAARDLSECLAIQLRDKDRLDPAMQCMLEHLDLIAQNEIKQLCKLCNVDREDALLMCAEIKALNPRPGSGFSNEKVDAVTPDIFLRRTGDKWNLELNAVNLPRVLVNRKYYTEICSKTSDKTEKKYLTEQFANANWLIKALDSRAQTILKVSREIIKYQENFFLYGVQDLRPLTLKEVAEEVSLHESTVSRVTTNKYIMTARGMYELKYFFNAAIGNTAGGENYSSRSVQFMIKEIIDKEGETILSDDDIAQKLGKRGIEIARRTVAKYRELIKIPTSSLRKREWREKH